MSSMVRSLALVAIVSMMVLSSKAHAAEEILSFSTTPSTTQAGGHPDVEIFQKFTTGVRFPVPPPPQTRPLDARRLITHLPTGVIGNPHVVPKCNLVDFSLGECSSDAQVGFVIVNPLLRMGAPVYNMEPRPDQAGLLAFEVKSGGVKQFIEIAGRTESDYGLDSINSPIYHLLAVDQIEFFLWGVPADPSHDPLRFKTPVRNDCNVDQATNCGAVAGVSASVPPEPFLSNPTTCGVPLTSRLEIEFYTGVKATAEAPWPATTGCDQLAFNPSLTVKPTTEEGDSASGLDADLRVPQIANPYTPSPSQIRGVTVSLPNGFSINPNAANGKLACAGADTAIGTRLAATCPQFSKVGTLSIDSSALPGPIPGGIYLGEPKPGDPYRLILAADGFGTHVKLAGSAKTDPATGQITVAFEDLPQSPLTQFDMHFFGSERGLLATPTHCGSYPVVADFEPWNDVLPMQSSTSFFTVATGPSGSPCPNGPRALGPGFAAGSLNPTAGRHTPFNVELSRRDGEQNLLGLNVATPPGFSGALRGISYCPEPALATLAGKARSGIVEQAEPSCPLESQIGVAVAGAGAGAKPLHTPGKVYLAGPYKGAPLSLVVVIPAVSGPYDLGNVAVRAAIHVDPVTARVTTISDPLPQILEGIPLRVRSIRIELDRPNFALNPTNCSPFSTNAQVHGTEGAIASLSSHYQVANCAILTFGPRLSMRMSGGTRRAGHPALKAVLTASQGEANLARTVVTLPKSQILDNANIQSPCTRVQFRARACPAGSVIGTAVAHTPLLDRPLEGLVHLRSSDNQLPDIVADLRGQIDVEVSARVDSVKGQIRTTFGSVPDVPVTRFALNLKGGRTGLLFNSENLCRGRQTARVVLVGQNGARVRRNTAVRRSCAAKNTSKRLNHHRLSTARKAGKR